MASDCIKWKNRKGWMVTVDSLILRHLELV